MALIGINQPQEKPRGPDALDRVAQAFQIAQAAIGTTLAIPEYLQKRDVAKAEKAKTEAETALIGSKKSEIDADAQPLSLEDQKYYVDQGVPLALIPKTVGQAKETSKTFWETPAQKASREKTDAAIALAASAEARAQRKEGQETVKFNREMAKPVLTPAEEDVDKKFATTYESWNAQGGYANASKNLNQARWAMKRLLDAQKDHKNYSGKDVGVVGMAGPNAKALVSPDAASMEEQVQQIVTSNLRAALGPQFTEAEGTRIMRQTFNPLLDEKENARRLGNLINELEQTFAAKEAASQYYREKGTLQGWSGKLKTFIKTEATPDESVF